MAAGGRLVRHGHLPEREIVTGIGPVAVRCPRVRDRAWRRLGAHPILVGDSAALRTAVEKPRGADSDPLPRRRPTGDFEDALAAGDVYFWVDGICVQAGLEDAMQCLLVIIGTTPEGKKELVGLIDGVREARNPGRSCSSISNGAALPWAPSLPSPTERSASGKPSRK